MNSILSHTIQNEGVLPLLVRMLQTNTINPPGNELPLAAWICKDLKSCGIEASVIDLGHNRGSVIGRIRGTGERKSLVLDGHLDTVPQGDIPWQHDPFSGHIQDGKIYGRGASDMKSGVAAMLAAVKAIQKSGLPLKGDLIFCASCDEETDSLGAVDFFNRGGLQGVGAVVIGEPNSNGITIAEKGCLWLRITTCGKTAHGSLPASGINAILHMNAILNELQAYTFTFTPHLLLSAPTMNISMIQGGVKTNVVPDKCQLTADLRTLPGMNSQELIHDIQRLIQKAAAAHPDLKASISILSDRPPVETAADDSFVTLCQAAARDVWGRTIQPDGFSGYTDAAAFLTAGLPIVISGPGELKMAHQPRVRLHRQNQCRRAILRRYH